MSEANNKKQQRIKPVLLCEAEITIFLVKYLKKGTARIQTEDHSINTSKIVLVYLT